MKSIIEIYKYREMFFNLVKRDLRVRYKGSTLGFLWSFLNPLLQLIIYTILFSTVMRVGIPNYPIFLFVGLIPWLFLATALQTSVASIVGAKDLVCKIYFPRAIIPLSVATTAFVNMMLSMLIVFCALLFSGIGFSRYLAYVPLIMLIEYLMVAGLSLFLSAANVFFRDIEHILSIVMMGWFYLTPVVYSVEMIPANALPAFKMNPMLAIIKAYRDIMFYQKCPNFMDLTVLFVISLLVLSIGYLSFEKLQKAFVEEL